MFRISLLFLFLCSCARVNPSYIDPEVQPYVDKFTDLIGVPPIGVSIRLVDTLESPAVGQCYLSAVESSISLDRAYWNKSSELGKENVVLHELGHCFLWLFHTNITFPDGCPASIMNPVAFGNKDCYIDHRDELLRLYKEDSGL